LETLKTYLGVVSERSDAMAANALNLLAAHPGEPLAITIGALHTERVIEDLTEAGVSVVLLRSQAHVEKSTAGLLSPEAWERKQEGGAVTPLGILLEGGKKPPPVAFEEPYKLQVSIRRVAQIFAEEARRLADEGIKPENMIGKIQDFWSAYPRDPTMPSGDIFIMSVSPGDAQNPNPSVDFDIMASVLGVDSEYHVVTFSVTARLIPGASSKCTASITVDGRLWQARDELKTASPANSEETSGIQPQPVCSNTEATFSTSH
jgi:hypothetical protein